MRYCNNCNWVTAGEPMFCNSCGRSYDLKLCPRLHPNPRTAQVCSQCGSRDLSTPQPHSSIWLRLLRALLPVLSGLFLLWISLLFLAGLAQSLLTHQELLFRFVFVGILVAFLWWCYLQLPRFLRAALTKLFRRERRDARGH
jgi:hypothetical protein